MKLAPMDRRAVVVAGGDTVPAARVRGLASGAAWVVAADSGLGLVRALEWPVHEVVGDMDSVSAADLAWGAGVPMHRAAVHKDETDLELALGRVAHLSSIDVVGGGGGRLDHLFGNLAVITSPRWPVRRWFVAEATSYVVRDRATLPLAAGQTFTLLAVGGAVEGLEVSGARWQLSGASLSPHEARGISNVAEGPVELALASGVLLAVVPVRL